MGASRRVHHRVVPDPIEFLGIPRRHFTAFVLGIADRNRL